MSGERDKRLLYTTLTRHIVVLLRNHVVHQIGLSTLQIFEPVHSPPLVPCSHQIRVNSFHTRRMSIKRQKKN